MSAGRGEAREDLAEPVTFDVVSYGVVCSGAGGCGALVATSQKARHREWHQALADAIPRPRDGGG